MTPPTVVAPSKTATLQPSLDSLQTMNLRELQALWQDLHGQPAPAYKATFLRKRLAYRLQVLTHGGLSKKTQQHLKQLAKKDPLAQLRPMVKPPTVTKLLPGCRLLRTWKEATHEVTVTDNGFSYNGQLFRSLSAIARHITGTRWNGKVFFGLKKSTVTAKTPKKATKYSPKTTTKDAS